MLPTRTWQWYQCPHLTLKKKSGSVFPSKSNFSFGYNLTIAVAVKKKTKNSSCESFLKWSYGSFWALTNIHLVVKVRGLVGLLSSNCVVKFGELSKMTVNGHCKSSINWGQLRTFWSGNTSHYPWMHIDFIPAGCGPDKQAMWVCMIAHAYIVFLMQVPNII